MYDLIKITLAIIALIIICFLIDLYSNKKKFKIKKREIINSYGKEVDIEDINYKMKNISTYFRNKNEESIDDITWSDLSMDDVYKKINNTQSTAGKEILYYILRNPIKDIETLKKRDNLIEYFRNNEDIRLELQLDFAKLGDSNDPNTTLSLFVEGDDTKSKLLLYRVLRALPIISIILTASNKSFLFFVLLSIGLNIFISYKNKTEQIDTGGFTYLIKSLNVAYKIKDKNIKEIDENIHDIKEDLKKVKKIKKKSVTSNPNSIMSELNVFREYYNMIFLSELITYEKVKETIINNKTYLKNIYEYVGTIDALIGIASFRDSLEYYSKPNLKISNNRESNLIEFKEIYHPLIEDPVTNSLKVKGGVLITGSNASGKSTFIKSIAINQILAQSIFTTCAREYNSSIFNIYTSMALKDDVLNNESYYIVEIKSLKRIIEKSRDIVPCLCFVDEILRGTNTIERIASSSEVLKHLNKSNCICFAATHDIELTYLLEGEFENYHFEEEITDNDIMFDYKLNPGRAKSRNAIKLLSLMGYKDEIVNNANNRAENFAKTGKWEQ